MKKRSIADLGKNAVPVTDEMRIAGQLALNASLQKMKDNFALYQAAPKSKAWDKMQGALVALRSDPEINVSEPCTDLLDMVIELMTQAWPHHEVQSIVQPLATHFDGVKSKTMNEAKRLKKEADRAKYHALLDAQTGITSTRTLAATLKRQFFLDLSPRASVDEVREWKKLRSAGKT